MVVLERVLGGSAWCGMTCEGIGTIRCEGEIRITTVALEYQLGKGPISHWVRFR